MADYQNSGLAVSPWKDVSDVLPNPDGHRSPSVWVWIFGDDFECGDVSTYDTTDGKWYPYITSTSARRTHWASISPPGAGGEWFDADKPPERPPTTDIYPRVWVWVRYGDGHEQCEVGAYDHGKKQWVRRVYPGEVVKWAWMRSPYTHSTPIDVLVASEPSTTPRDTKVESLIGLSIANLAINEAHITPEQAARALKVLQRFIPSVPQFLLDDLMAASDRLTERVDTKLRTLDPQHSPDIHGIDYAMGQLSGLHIAIAALEIDGNYMDFEGDDDSPIKFTGIGPALFFEEKGAEFPELRTNSEGTYWNRAIGESWEFEPNDEHLKAAFKRWRDRFNQIATE